MTDAPFSERLAALRQKIKKIGCDGMLVPMADQYQSEYLPPSAQRITFLSGFTGSSGSIVILKDKAAFFTDSRYTIQAAQQVDPVLYQIFDYADKTPLAWLEENAESGVKIAYDPWLHAHESAERLKKSVAKIDGLAVAVDENPVDQIWKDRPAEPMEPVVPYELAYAGKKSVDKRKEIAAEIQKRKAVAQIITDSASVAWLLNVRGNDTENTPLPLSRAILKEDGSVEWFIDARKMTKDLSTHMGGDIKILPPEDFAAALDRLAQAGKPILLDPSSVSDWIVGKLKQAKGVVETCEDLSALPRAIKNITELEGIRAAHRRDGAALTRFLSWLDTHWEKEQLNEISAAEKLASFRRENNNYRGPSFDTISGAGPHGAIVHYHATEESNAKLEAGQLYLLDSGGQYLDGTTDVTRTVALGEPTADMRAHFTRVLKGHIALAAVRFPEGTTGADLDVLARHALWAVGLDFGHGTGHGVGCYLGVHEGPQAISKRNKVPLKPGMILSNEPGFYKEGAYGIRIENLQAVVEITSISTEQRKFYGFEALTLAPIDRRLIDVALLNEEELRWLNAYHQRVLQALKPALDVTDYAWLEAATRPIEK